MWHEAKGPLVSKKGNLGGNHAAVDQFTSPEGPNVQSPNAHLSGQRSAASSAEPGGVCVKAVNPDPGHGPHMQP